jgi:membrane protease YdiL (CAAX protease family)
MSLYDWLKRLPLYFFIPLVLAILGVITTILNCLSLNPGENPLVDGYSLQKAIIIGCIFVPVIETLILQMLPIELIMWIKTKKKRIMSLIAIVVSSAAFASTHWFNLRYVALAFVFGLVFASAYIICKDKKGSGYALGVITIIHMLWNSIATIEMFCFT